MKVIVYEYVSGGGYAGQPIPAGVLAEGYGMLRSVVADFSGAGHEVTVLLDARLSKLNPPLNADCVVPIVYPQEPEKFLNAIAQINDAAYIIAPETNGMLRSLVDLIERTGKISLNCESKAIDDVTDKSALYTFLQKNGVPIPKTLVLELSGDLTQINQIIKHDLNYPVIFKPVDGVGCSGLRIIKQETQIPQAIAAIKEQSKSKRFVVQEFLTGESVSVSLLSTDKKAQALSLNKQTVTLAGPSGTSSYDGGCTPCEHPAKREVFALAEKVVELFSGLRGYVGVDLVLVGEKAFVLDVNPRLTTSYVGLQKVAHFNVAEALMNAVINGNLPEKTENRGVACFSKIEIPTPTLSSFKNAAKLANVVSPPFPLNESSKFVALIIGEGETVDYAMLHLEEAKKRLHNIIS